MRLENVGLAAHRSAINGRLVLAIGLLAGMLTALAPAAARANSSISVTSSLPATVTVGETGVAGEVTVTNLNTAPEDSTTICESGTAGCGGSPGITLIPSCSLTSGPVCDPSGADKDVFQISSTATGTGTGCAGRAFTVTVIDTTFGTVRFAPTVGTLTIPKDGVCHINYTVNVLKAPVDAVAATTGLQTRQRVAAAALANPTNEFATAGGSGIVTVKLAAPTLSAVSPAGPANNNNPKILGTAPNGTASVTLYDGPNCTGDTVTGSAATFASPGFTFTVDDDSSTTFSATVTDSQGGVSACSAPASTVTYVEDSTPPAVPSITDTDPDSPSNNNTPRIKGTAAAGSTVKIYTNATCTNTVLVSGTAAEFATPGLLAPSLPSNATTTLYATASDTAGNESGCSAVFSYVEDSTPPAQPTPTSSNPGSPANDNTPQIVGTAAPGSTVTLYTTPNCTGAAAGQGSAASFGSSGIEVTVADNSSTTFYAIASDQAGNVSPCSIGFTYVEDSIPPASAVIGGSSPASPSNQNSPRITGTAPAGTTVRLYTDAACSGGIAAEGTAAAFAGAGIPVSVSDNTTTTFYARSVDAAGNASPCSATSVTYVEDSGAPQTTIDAGPSGSGAPATPTFTFSSTDSGATFECRLDGGAFAPCTSPFTTPALGEGTHTFEVRAKDGAGNTGTSIVRTFTVGGAVTPPPPPSVLPPPPPPPVGPAARPQPGCLGIKGTVYVGTANANIRNGVNTTDIMFGLGGNDSLRGAAGLDCLYGGTGNDLLRGGSGADRLFGERGNDRLEGLAGNDRLSGSRGNDRLNGGTGNDRNTAGSGNDRITDRRGTDRFSGGSGSDRIDARDSTPADRRKRDRILCGAGIDRVLADPSDIVARDCEKRFVVKRSLR